MVKEKFLIDSDAFIEPYRNYYAFDLIPTYWAKLSIHIKAWRLILLDMVRLEIEKGQDDLNSWINSQEFVICKHVDAEIINQYSLILNYIEASDFYNEAALRNWASADRADPWLIAAAKVYGYTIITSEAPSGGLSTKQPTKNPKIPDVAKEFDVKTGNIFYMMRQLGIKI